MKIVKEGKGKKEMVREGKEMERRRIKEEMEKEGRSEASEIPTPLLLWQ